MEWYLKVVQNYVDFSGRARRKEYWWFFLINLIIVMVLTAIDFLVLGADESGLTILSSLYTLAILLPGIGVTIRRLHDTGRSGWWYFIVLVPLVGPIILLYFFFQDSEAGSNAWGPNPKEKGLV